MCTLIPCLPPVWFKLLLAVAKSGASTTTATTCALEESPLVYPLALAPLLSQREQNSRKPHNKGGKINGQVTQSHKLSLAIFDRARLLFI